MSETENLPATQETDAERQRRRMEALMAAVSQRSDMLVTLLSDTGISFDRFREVLRRAIIKGQEKPATNLLLADAGSVIQSCIDACTAGLLPDGKQGAIVIYNVNIAEHGQRKQYVKRAQFIPMYQGLLHIAYASRNFRSIEARVVYEGDDWDYELGIEPRIRHKPAKRDTTTVSSDGEVIQGRAPKLIAAYAVAKTVDGGVFVEVFEPDDIRKVMAVSRAKSGPAKDWPEEMARKGPLRRMWKFLPRNDRMDRVLEVDDDNYDLDNLHVPEEPAEPALKRGFAQPALTQAANVPMEMVKPEPDGVPAGDVEHGDEMLARDVEVPDEEGSPPPDEAESPTDGRPPRVTEYVARLAEANNWLAIKQALRSLYKADDWDRERWERAALVEAWERKVTIGDRTDFVTDCWLFACWCCGGMEVDPASVAANLEVLETQADWKKATDDTREWVRRIATG